MARSLFVFLLLVLACGRSNIGDDAVSGGDAGLGGIDGGTDAGAVIDAGVASTALAVFVANTPCPTTGLEAALKPGPNEQLTLVKGVVEEECSGAGGDWLRGTLLDGSQLAFGAHACFFIPASLPRASFGLVRLAAPGRTLSTPMGWCLLPVQWNREVLAWGVYSDELSANAARARLLSP